MLLEQLEQSQIPFFQGFAKYARDQQWSEEQLEHRLQQAIPAMEQVTPGITEHLRKEAGNGFFGLLRNGGQKALSWVKNRVPSSTPPKITINSADTAAAAQQKIRVNPVDVGGTPSAPSSAPTPAAAPTPRQRAPIPGALPSNRLRSGEAGHQQFLQRQQDAAQRAADARNAASSPPPVAAGGGPTPSPVAGGGAASVPGTGAPVVDLGTARPGWMPQNRAMNRKPINPAAGGGAGSPPTGGGPAVAEAPVPEPGRSWNWAGPFQNEASAAARLAGTTARMAAPHAANAAVGAGTAAAAGGDWTDIGQGAVGGAIGGGLGRMGRTSRFGRTTGSALGAATGGFFAPGATELTSGAMAGAPDAVQQVAQAAANGQPVGPQELDGALRGAIEGSAYGEDPGSLLPSLETAVTTGVATPENVEGLQQTPAGQEALRRAADTYMAQIKQQGGTPTMEGFMASIGQWIAANPFGAALAMIGIPLALHGLFSSLGKDGGGAGSAMAMLFGGGAAALGLSGMADQFGNWMSGSGGDAPPPPPPGTPPTAPAAPPAQPPAAPEPGPVSALNPANVDPNAPADALNPQNAPVLQAPPVVVTPQTQGAWDKLQGWADTPGVGPSIKQLLSSLNIASVDDFQRILDYASADPSFLPALRERLSPGDQKTLDTLISNLPK